MQTGAKGRAFCQVDELLAHMKANSEFQDADEPRADDAAAGRTRSFPRPARRRPGGGSSGFTGRIRT